MRRYFPFLLAILSLAITCAAAALAQTTGAAVPAPTAQAAPGQQPSQGPQPPPAPRARISGHVFAQDTGHALKGAGVTLREVRHLREPVTVFTDAQGAFRFSSVEPGNYRVFCARSGFVIANYAPKGEGQPGTTIAVRPGEDLVKIDFYLARGGVISGTVLDDDGEPLSRVRVQAMSRRYSRSRVQFLPRGMATTDDRGQYRIFNLPAGRYVVQAMYQWGWPDVSAASGYAPVYFPGVLSGKDAQRIELSNGGEASRTDFRMMRIPTFSISGRVVEQPTGQPPPGAVVQAIPVEDPYGMMNGYATVRSEGAFNISGLQPGRYRILAMSNGRAGETRQSYSGLIDLPPADIHDLTITLGPGVTVKGRIIAEGGQLTAKSPQLLFTPKGEGRMMGEFVVKIDPDDLTFEKDRVQPGEYNLDLTDLGGACGNFYLREARVDGRDMLEQGIIIGDHDVDMEIVLDFHAARINGRLTNDRDEPVTGAVVLVSADRAKWGIDRYFRTTNTDQNGSFVFQTVIPGDYLALAWPDNEPGKAQDPELMAQLEKYASFLHVEVSGSATQDLKLSEAVAKLVQAASQ